MRGLGRVAALGVICGGGMLLGRPAGADGEDPAGRPALLETRYVSVGALTRPRAEFFPDRGPAPVPPDAVNDEARPLFGGEAEEGVRALGTIDALIELVKSSMEPKAWDVEGAAFAPAGNGFVLIRGPKALLDATERVLADLERDALALVTVDVIALEGDAAAAAGERGVAAGLSSGALRITAAVRACAYPGQRVSVLSGGERAYLADHDVEVAEDASTTDSIVGVLNEGLCVSLRPIVSGDDLRLDLSAWLARLDGLEVRQTVDGDTVETPVMRAFESKAPLLKVGGGWTYLAAAKDMGFAVRASTRRPAASGPGTSLPGAARTAPLGPLVSTRLDVADLTYRVASTSAARLFIRPSNFTPAEDPELPEPVAAFRDDQLVKVTRELVDPESWEAEGTHLDVPRHCRCLDVRTDAAHTAAVKDFLTALRKVFLRSYRVKATVVSLPLAALPELGAGLDDGATLLADGGTALLARAGARIEDRASVRFLGGGRGGVEQGKVHRYVGDYDAEIAQKAKIGNAVVYSALEGFSLDVSGRPTADGSALDLEVRSDRTIWQEGRRIKTRHGEIECPRIGLTRIRGSLLVPVGATRLAGVSVEGDRATLVLLTALAE